jgi:outer membrane biosynthesis protein TonB
MVSSYGDLHAPPAAAVRWTAAVAASLALHAAAAFVLTGALPGSPAGAGSSSSSHPLQALIVAPPAAKSASEPPAVAVPERVAAAAAASPAHRAADVPRPLGVRQRPVYYLPSELDVRPRLTTRVDPVYPRLAPPDGGYVLLRLLIGEDGWVERALVVVADPEGYFEEAAADAFGSARFSPGKRGGIAVKSQLWIELKFHPLAPPGTAATSIGEAVR